MKQTLKTAAALFGILAAGVILNYFMKALGCLMIFIADTCEIPL